MLTITSHMDSRAHRRIVDKGDEILEEEAKAEDLEWDPKKESMVRSRGSFKDQTITLGVTINSKLNFQPHINARTKKATNLFNVMRRPGTTNGWMSPRALRALLKGAIRPIFTYVAELWNGSHRTNISEMERLEYRALRKI